MKLRIRVAVAHDSALVRDLLRLALQRRRIGVVAETGELPQLLALCRAERPDVVISETSVGGQGLEAFIPDLVALGVRVLVVSDDVSPEAAITLLRRGVGGIVSTDVAVDALVAAVGSVRRGEVPLDPRPAAALVADWRRLREHDGEQGNGVQLSTRESAVLAALSQGLTTKAAAHALGLSVKTVENHKTRIFSKLGVRTQAEAVAVAIGGGLIAGTTDVPSESGHR